MKKLMFLLLLLSSFCFGDDFIIDEPNSKTSNQQAFPSLNNTPPAMGSSRLTSIGSVLTPDSMPKSSFSTEFTIYDGGGVTTRLLVGVIDIFSIGVSENFDGLIGSSNVNVNIPGAYVKFNLLKDFNNFNWAIGFDSFAYGKNGTYYSTNNSPSTIYGFYSTSGFRYSLFGGSDIFVFGFRIPLLPSDFRDLSNTSLFAGATAWVSSYFVLGLTLENWYVATKKFDQILPSFIVTFLPSSQFKLSFALQYQFYSSSLNRVINLGYDSSF